MIPEAEIKARIAELGRQIAGVTKTAAAIWCLIGLLPHSAHLCLADLCREVQVSHMKVELYDKPPATVAA